MVTLRDIETAWRDTDRTAGLIFLALLAALIFAQGCQCIIITGNDNFVEAEKTSANDIRPDTDLKVPLPTQR